MRLIVRQMVKEDYEPYKELFDEAYNEYLESLRLNNPQQYQKEKHEKRKVTHSRFNFYLKTGSSFVAEEKGQVIGYVASQTIPYMHGVYKLLWIEYIVVKPERKRRAIATALLHKLIDYAKHNSINRIYTTINPDNTASIELHKKAGFNITDRKVASLQTGC